MPEVDPERDIKAREWYKASQAQRALERAIRQELRVIEGSLDPENILKAKTRLKKLRARLRQHIKDNPQTRRKPERERIIGEAKSHSTVLG